jgi:hypothetical protein
MGKLSVLSTTHLLRRLSACVLLALVCAGCSRGEGSAAIGRSGSASAPVSAPVNGDLAEAVDGNLAEAVAGLCLARQQASTDVPAAKATYEKRSRQGVETTIGDLRPSYSILASRMSEATSAVEADLATDPPPPSLGTNLASLLELTREGAARLGTATSACEKEGRR